MGDTVPNNNDALSQLASISARLHQEIDAQTPAQKRALSYSVTICQLFNQVMQSKLPADRILADYFRSHKKHGSKDRRVIRETLFGLFRWHGWLKTLSQEYSETQAWFASLTLTATLEQHGWQEFIQAWQAFANLPELAGIEIEQAQAISDDTADLESTLLARQRLLQRHFPSLNFAIRDLLPAWFWQQQEAMTEQAQLTLVSSLCSRPPIWGRVQGISVEQAIAQLKTDDVSATASRYFNDAIHLGHKSINLNAIKLYSQGKLEIQDLGSQVIGHICAPKPDELWWDCCSGAGGKSLQLRSLMLQQDPKAKGAITASDIRRKPLEELNKRAQRAGFTQISLAPWQSEALPVQADGFDGVLVDAPCSCTGTWRRNPDMRWLDEETAVTDKPQLQLDILSRAAKAVKPGGKLVYATCSICPAENEEVVNAFLAAAPEFTLETITHPFTAKPCTMLTVQPYQADSDGMFVAKLVRKP
ncbi:RsmB/NOP family class I SAM-dependent RNA methyltransferase [Shewanella sp. AS1]|uniref:RsmB/NOP family class I SAM-dependent RNA methyltransferase n=1 Tax=Shewanella sp. AS1 TaxID=2907626 RepID=UPI001F351358|nr:RsmB/NOP family class I SAM-dependent RNA methyltransferase [Shewanella sp. AS1]MCE9678108.1 RsmB/NOP family class I SAM-dependent RNA methyltransferase [Shewanella sp. AS1]